MKKLKLTTESDYIQYSDFPNTVEDFIKFFTDLRDSGWTDCSMNNTSDYGDYMIIEKIREETDEEYIKRINLLEEEKQKEKQRQKDRKKQNLERELKEYERLKKKFEKHSARSK